jgi:DNA-binding FadR family transcriptional regulator
VPKSLLEPLARETLTEQTVRSLKRYILTESMHPGDRLPSERLLCEMLGVSRNVIREALSSLVTEGYIEKEAGRGAFVRPYDVRQLQNELAEHIGDVEQVRDLAEVRAALEIGALSFVIRRISADELARLRVLVEQMRELLDRGQSLASVDREFHETLMQATDNPAFVSLSQSIWRTLRLKQFDLESSAFHSPHRDTRSLFTAERVVEALEQHDLEGAESAMRNHLTVSLPPEQSRVLLFVDDGEIESMRRLTRTLHTANKHPHNPVLRPEYEWEGLGISPGATVLFDDERKEYRMWYEGYRYLSMLEEQYTLCYATSTDGIHWRKPWVGIVEFEGSRENNLLIPWGDPARHDTMSSTIFYDPDSADADRRYTMIHFCHGMHPLGLGISTSPDGLRWTPMPDNPVDAGGDEPVGDVLYALVEPGNKHMAAYYRVRLRVRPRRTLARAESTDLVHWTGHQVILEADEDDPPDAELCGLTPFRYGDLILGFLWVATRNGTRAEVQLACSRDGTTWQRVGDRRPFLPQEDEGPFGNYMVARTTVPIVVGNELWFYYTGMERPLTEPLGNHPRGIGLATLTMDRFVSLDAGDDEGDVVTRPIDIADQTRILINAIANPGGSILVELLDVDGKPIPGYTRDDALPFEDNAVFHPVAWRHHARLADLEGQTLRIRFILRRARLFAFRLCRPDAAPSDLVAGIC